MTASRLPLRLARREVLRRPGRTALVALLVALPVTAMVLALVLLRTGSHTLDEEWQQQYGTSEAVVQGGGTYQSAPEGTRAVETVRTGGIRVLTADGHRATVDVEDLSPTEPLAAGRSVLSAGRAPAAPGEIALSSEALAKLHVDVGDQLELARPAGTYEVVGEVAFSECFRCPRAVVAPGTLSQVVGDRGQLFGTESATLLDLPRLDAAATAALDSTAQSQSVMLRDRFVAGYYQDPDVVDASAISWTLVVGALVLTVVGIVISAAFAVGARRQLVTIGQLSASGAPPTSVRTALMLQGTVTGAIGAVMGILLAAGLCLGLRHQVEYVLDQPIDHYRFAVGEVLAAALIGVAAATVAALIPARSAARVPTLAALAGRRPLPPVSRGLVVKGLVAVVAGLALFGLAIVGGQGTSGSGQLWAYVAILGGITEVLGACALAPAVVARLEPLAHRLRGGLRLGARGLARQRARTGAVVSAVCAAGALAVAAGGAVLGSSLFQDSVDSRLPDDVVIASQQLDHYDNTTSYEETLPTAPAADVLDQLRAALPKASVSPYRVVRLPAELSGRGWNVRDAAAPAAPSPADDGSFEVGFGFEDAPVVADPSTLDAVRAGDTARRAVAEDGAVVLAPGLSGRAVVTDPTGHELDLRIVPSQYTLGYGPMLLVSPTEAERLGLTVATQASLFDNPGPLSDEQIDALEDVQYFARQGDFSAVSSNRFIDLRRDDPHVGPTEAQLELLLGGLALVFALFVVGVSLALAAAESKDERDILTIAGAPPSTVARSAGARAWLMATIGAVMAVPVGFLPIVVVHLTSDTSGYVTSFPLVFPSRTVALLVLAVPAIVAVVSYGASATAQRVRPVRISTATFE